MNWVTFLVVFVGDLRCLRPNFAQIRGFVAQLMPGDGCDVRLQGSASNKIVVGHLENRSIWRCFGPSLPQNEKERPIGLARGLPTQRTCDTKRSLPGRKPFRGIIFLYVSESFS